MSNNSPTDSSAWRALSEHHAALDESSIADLFSADKTRFENFSLTLDGLLFDYSKNLVTAETLELLSELAQDCDVEGQRDKMFSGAPINHTENRAVLHTALRGSISDTVKIDSENVKAFVENTHAQIKAISDTVRKERLFTNIVNIGIGGSDLGAHMVHEALKPFSDGPKVHFVSNIDGAHIAQTIADLEPERTLFIIASKTFTTLETTANAQTARKWITDALGANAVKNHFIAITSNDEGAKDFGITETNILPLRDWIGGRYSLWSAIGLPIALSIGFEKFKDLLAGACAMDKHFQTAPLNQNIPVIMALIGIWHRNFCDYGAMAVLPYLQNLERLPTYIQQLDMESNGKSVNKNGAAIKYATSPVIFGAPGTNAQHAFFQLLHQGTQTVPCDFILAARATHNLPEHHEKLLANALAQSEALMNGRAAKADQPHKNFTGNRPSSTVVVPQLDPYHLGLLLALYEHKVFVQGIIWNINSFDQWGVELGKELAQNIIHATAKDSKNNDVHCSTKALMKHIQTAQE